MEPVTTLIGTVVGYLAKQIKEGKAFKDFTSDFSDAAIKWIRPIFLKDDKEEAPKEVLADLQADPDEQLNADAAANAIAKALKKEPEAEQWLREIATLIAGKTGATIKNNTMTVTGDGNFSLQDVSGSSINFGNNTTTQQTHHGSGDNVGGNKIVNG